MIHSKLATCPDCGSDNPAITVGWPVCRNDVFHREIRHTTRRFGRGRHRATKRSITVADLQRQVFGVDDTDRISTRIIRELAGAQ